MKNFIQVRDAPGAQLVAQVVTLQALAGVKTGPHERKRVAAFLGDQIHRDSRRVGLRRDAPDFNRRFLHRRRIHEVARRPVSAIVVGLHAVIGEFGATLAVHGVGYDVARRPKTPGAADIGPALQPGDQLGVADQTLPAAWQHVEQLVGEHGLLPDVLYVNDGAGPGHGDRFFDAANTELHIDCRREAGGQLDSFPDDRAEAGEKETDRIGPWPQVDDVIAALPIGDRNSLLLDQGWARGCYGDAGQHAARIVPHFTRNAACLLCRGARWNECQDAHCHDADPTGSFLRSHDSPCFARIRVARGCAPAGAGPAGQPHRTTGAGEHAAAREELTRTEPDRDCWKCRMGRLQQQLDAGRRAGLR